MTRIPSKQNKDQTRHSNQKQKNYKPRLDSKQTSINTGQEVKTENENGGILAIKRLNKIKL